MSNQKIIFRHLNPAGLVGAGRSGAVLFMLVLATPAARGQRPISDQDTITYLSQTISWYKDVTAFVDSPGDSRDAMFAEELRRSSTETLRLAFEFARWEATIPGANTPEGVQSDTTRSRSLAQAASAAEQRVQQAQTQVEQLNRQLEEGPARSRARLIALRDEVTSEMNFAKARRDALRSLIGFLSSPGQGGLGDKIRELERSVSEIASSRQAAPAEPATIVRTAPVAGGFHPESAGIVGLSTATFSILERIRRLDRLVEELDMLRQSIDRLRGPLRNALREVITRGEAIAQAPDSSDVAALRQRQTDLDGLLARFRQLSGLTAPLSEQSAQIGADRARLLEWRASLRETYTVALRYLLLRIGILAAGLALICGFSELWRRGTLHYVQDLRRRRQFLLLRRIVIGCAVVLVTVLSFVTEFGSLATFAGFSAAGIAVAMQSVILSVVAYFFLVGRWGVRAGDRVTVSGVTGEVADVGLFRLYLMELDGSGPGLQPTGRVVVFPNSVFFQPAPLFKQVPGIEYVWRAITVKLSGTTDYSVAERGLLDAVESVYAEYRDSLERQHRAAHVSLNLDIVAPRPESRVRLVDSGVEISISYPVEIRRAAEIDDRITREVIQRVERDPRMMLTVGGGNCRTEHPMACG